MEFIYSLFENYGLWVLLIIISLGQLGLPIGSMFFLMWYGSTIESSAFLLIAIPATACAAVFGDITAYFFGHRFSQQLSNAENKYSWLAKRIQHSRTLIDRYGIWVIWLTRFLITGLGPIVNYLLGSRDYPLKKFLLWVTLGKIIFTAELIYFGYHFKDTWEELLAIISDAGWLIILIILAIFMGKKLIFSKKTG